MKNKIDREYRDNINYHFMNLSNLPILYFPTFIDLLREVWWSWLIIAQKEKKNKLMYKLKLENEMIKRKNEENKKQVVHIMEPGCALATPGKTFPSHYIMLVN